MGKSILIITLGVSVIISFFMLRLNANSKEGVNVSTDKFCQNQARLIANAGVEIYLEKLKADESLLDKTFTDNSLFDGEYDVTIQGPESLIKVTSVATFQDAVHKTIVYAQADKIALKPPPGSIYLAADVVGTFENNSGISGSVLIDGNNHDINGVLLNDGTVVPGIAVESDIQKAEVIDLIKKSAVDQVLGTGGLPSVVAVADTTDWEDYALQLVENPDIIIDDQTQIVAKNVWGTVDDPKITFINGDISIEGSDLVEGCGILVVNGNLKIAGDFTYRGLIIAYVETNIDILFSGRSTIIGGMVVAGESIGIEVASGNFSSLYSLPALSLVSSLLQTNRFNILSWWE